MIDVNDVDTEGTDEIDRGCVDGQAHTFPKRWEGNSDICTGCGALASDC